MAQVHLPALLRPAAGGERMVAVAGQTIREVIGDLDRRHPGFAERVLDGQTGAVRAFLNVYANDEDVRYLQGLDTPVAEHDIITFLPAVAGGR
jgi:molybdopterin synthase sulfur carrier subunit